VIRESSMMSFNDVFLVLTVLLVMVIPLVFFMRQIYHSEQHDQKTDNSKSS
jgi:hypothetical protein